MEKNIEYLKDLESILYRPLIDYTLKNEISSTDRLKFIKTITNYSAKLKTDHYILSLTITLADIYLSLANITNQEFLKISEGIGCMCMDLAASTFSTWSPDLSNYKYVTQQDYSDEQFINIRLTIIEVLNGQIIRPSTYFFLIAKIQKENMEAVNFLAEVSYHMSDLMIYKPSEIAEALYFILTGKVSNLHFSNSGIICSIIINYIRSIYDYKLIHDYKLHLECPVYPRKAQSPMKLQKYKKVVKDEPRNIKKEIKKSKKLGQGGFAKVFRLNKEDTNYAVKFYTFFDENDEYAESNGIINELSILSLLSNNNSKNSKCKVVHFKGFEPYVYNKKDFSEIGIFMFFELGIMDLEKYITTKNISDYQKLKIMEDILQGLVCLHYNDIIHGDMKPQNVVVFVEGDIETFKIIDFGSSIAYSSFRIHGNTGGTITYTAPEILLFQPYDYKSDIWSLGLVFYFIITGITLLKAYAEKVGDEDQILMRILALFGIPTEENWPGVTKVYNFKENTYDYASNPNLSGNPTKYGIKSLVKVTKEQFSGELGIFYSLIMSCLKPNPNDRPTAEQLLKCIDLLKIGSLC